MSQSPPDLIGHQARDHDRDPFLYLEDQVVTFGEFNTGSARTGTA